MRDLNRINYNSENPAGSRRELHAYGFRESRDFCSILRESTGARPSILNRYPITAWEAFLEEEM